MPSVKPPRLNSPYEGGRLSSKNAGIYRANQKKRNQPAQPTQPAQGFSAFDTPGMQSTSPDARQQGYLSRIRTQREKGINVPNPLEGGNIPQSNPFTGRAWKSGAEYNEFASTIGEAFQPIPDQDKINAWSKGNVLSRAGTPTDKNYGKNVPEMLFGSTSDGADAAVRRNMNTGLVSDTQKGEYQGMRKQVREKMANFLEGTMESVTVNQLEGVAGEVLRTAGPQMQSFVTAEIKREFGKHKKGREALAAMEAKYEQATFDTGNELFRGLTNDAQGEIRSRIAHYEAGILAPGESMEDIMNQVGMEGEGMSQGQLLSKRADALKQVYGLGQAAPGQAAPAVRGTIKTGEESAMPSVDLMDDDTIRLNVDSLKALPVQQRLDQINSFLKNPSGNVDAEYIARVEQMRDATIARLPPAIGEAITEKQTEGKPTPSKATDVLRGEYEDMDLPSFLSQDIKKIKSAISEFSAPAVDKLMDALGLSESERKTQHAKLVKSAEKQYRKHADSGDYHLIPTSWLKRHKKDFPDIPSNLLK